jgi:hypothetical protein
MLVRRLLFVSALGLGLLGACGGDTNDSNVVAGGGAGGVGTPDAEVDSSGGAGGAAASAGSGAAPVDASAPDSGDATAADSGDGSSIDELGCPPGAVKFEQLGLVHAPTVGNEYKRVTFKPPAGLYAEVRLALEVFAPDWNDPTAGMRHMLFWFARDGKHFDLFGYAALVAQKTVLLRHGIGIAAGAKPKITASATLPMPETYHVRYRYDMAGGVAVLDLTRGTPAVPVAKLTDVPNVQNIAIGANGTVDVDLGNQGPTDPYPNPQEPPQYGWTFSDLRVCLIPQ